MADELKILFPDGDDEGAFIITGLTPAHKPSALRIEETWLENQCSNLPLFGNRQLFALVSPDLSVPGVSPEVLQRVLSQASTANV